MDYSVGQLISEVRGGEAVSLSDQQLFDVAYAAVDELRQRMPRYAFEQGDLDWESAEAVKQMMSAEEAVDALDAVAEAWEFDDFRRD